MKQGQINYNDFQKMSKDRYGTVIADALQSRPMTYEELAEKTNLDRTSVFYHVKRLKNKNIVTKRFFGRICYIGLISKLQPGVFSDKKESER